MTPRNGMGNSQINATPIIRTSFSAAAITEITAL